MESGRGQRLLLALGAAVALAACGPAARQTPPGVLTLDFVPAALTTANLVPSSVLLRLERIAVFADLPPPQPPPPLGLMLDALATAGMSLTLSMIPQGLYSRVQLNVEHVSAQGTWRGTPFALDLGGGPMPPPGMGPLPGMVDLRSPNGQDVEPGHDGAFTIGVDPNGWFAGDLLDAAMPAGGMIVCSAQSNPAVAATLLQRVLGSFSIQ